MNNEKTMADVLSYGPFTDEEIEYMCEWAPEMGDDLDTLRIWIDEYDLRPVDNDELENYLDDGYEVMFPADAGYDGGMKTHRDDALGLEAHNIAEACVLSPFAPFPV